MLTRIRNAVRVEKPFVDIPSSRFKRGIADVLKREGFIWDWKEVDEENPTSTLRLELKYGPNGERVIQTIKRISKPGRRMYTRGKELKPVLGGLGISIISAVGVISDHEARRENIGGEAAKSPDDSHSDPAAEQGCRPLSAEFAKQVS